jgi:hypothetical protein
MIPDIDTSLISNNVIPEIVIIVMMDQVLQPYYVHNNMKDVQWFLTWMQVLIPTNIGHNITNIPCIYHSICPLHMALW